MPGCLFFLMAGASDLFSLIASDAFQLYLWHLWQYVCKHKAFSDLSSCHLAITRYRLSIAGVRKGIPCPWPQALLVFLFLPKSEHSSFIALWENGNRSLQAVENWQETAIPGVSHQQLLATVGSWGQKCSRESCTHQLSLSLGCRIDMLRGMLPHFIPGIRWVNNPKFPSFTKTHSFSTFSTKTQERDIVHIVTK